MERRIRLALVMLLAGAMGFATWFVQPASATVRGKQYSIWVSPSFGVSPYPPFQDCATFTQTTMDFAGCGDGQNGVIASETNLGSAALTLWVGIEPCSGLNLLAIGTSFDGSTLPIGADVMGGSIIGLTEGSSFGIEGVRDQCPAPLSLDGGNPYSN